jgi:hypothetical protein
MRARKPIFRVPVGNAKKWSSLTVKRKIWTSATRLSTSVDVKEFMQSKLIVKHKKVMIPDFASLNSFDSMALFDQVKSEIDLRNLQLIIASSNNEKDIDYDRIGGEIEKAATGGMDGTLVVKGSGRPALVDTPKVRQQYTDTIKMVIRAGSKLLLPLRIDLPEDLVLRDIERRMKLGASGFMTHPVFNVSLVSPAVIKTLRAIVKEHPDFTIRIGALWLTEEFFHRIAAKDGRLVTEGGLDQYPMRDKPPDGNWEQWNSDNMVEIRNLVKAIGSKQEMSDSTYSRVGMGHSEDSVMKIASIIEEYSQELPEVHGSPEGSDVDGVPGAKV